MSLILGLIYGIVGMGIYLTFRVIDFPDLTCDGSFVLGAAISSILIKYGYNPYFALLIAIMGGMVAGSVTGILNCYFKVTDLLAGILVAFMLYSVNIHVMGGIPNISLMGAKTIFPLSYFELFGYSFSYSLIYLAVISIALVAVFTWILSTNLGLSLRAIGQNKRLCLNGGVNVKWMIILGVALGNGLIALGGALFSQQQGFGDLTSGIGTIIAGFAAVIIGEKILPFRSIWVKILSCIIGSVAYRVITSIALNTDIWEKILPDSLHHLQPQTSDFNLIAGLLIIFVMAMPGRKNA
ncbi:ABC transporter permease [Wohlfahrtiimonas larvae]